MFRFEQEPNRNLVESEQQQQHQQQQHQQQQHQHQHQQHQPTTSSPPNQKWGEWWTRNLITFSKVGADLKRRSSHQL